MPGCDFELPTFSVQMPGKGKTDMCCERCVFGQGYHEEWCPEFGKGVVANLQAIDNLLAEEDVRPQ